MTNVKSKNEFIKNNLMKIFDILILPNISITQEDEDEYEDEGVFLRIWNLDTGF